MSYVDVADQHVWHEVSGEGEPVLLLHGAFAGASSWFAQTPVIAAAGFRVYVPERRAHVHTADVPGPLTYSVMAADTIDYLKTVVGGAAHLVGWSDGAVVALIVALQRPDLVNRLVLIGQYYNSEGRVGGGPVEQGLEPGSEAVSFLRTEYDAYSPDGPDHFPVVYDKVLHMIQTEPQIDLATLDAVVAPTLILQGDRDDVSVEHSLAVCRAIADGRLAVIPGSHGLPLESPDLVNPLIISFLRGGPPPPLF